MKESVATVPEFSSHQKEADNETVSLRQLVELTGFPEAIIRKELNLEDIDDKGEVPFSELREAMIRFVDSSMLADSN